MLIAEIHGKRLPEVEGQEDWLTSAVFGHLRQISPGGFWFDLFSKAVTVGKPKASLSSILAGSDVTLATYDRLDVVFWRYCKGYGEPDLLLRFTGEGIAPLIVLIELKLNSVKSNLGEDDQLATYLDLLDDRTALAEWNHPGDHRYLIYLTQIFANLELEDSIPNSKNSAAVTRMFGLEWRNILEAAQAYSLDNDLLREVALFLRQRGFESFKGMRSLVSA